jgi:tetratricopeptide (TPR) repeat protein
MKRTILLSVAVGTLLWGYSSVEDKFGQKVSSSFELNMQKAKTLRIPYKKEYAPKESIAILLEMLKEKPDYYRGHYNLGLAYFEDKEYEKSKASFDKALEIRQKQNIQDATIFNAAGWTAMKAQDYIRAQKLFLEGVANKKLNTQASNAILFENLGLLYFYTQRFDEALKYLNLAKDTYGSKSAQTTIDTIEDIKNKAKQSKNATLWKESGY